MNEENVQDSTRGDEEDIETLECLAKNLKGKKGREQ